MSWEVNDEELKVVVAGNDVSDQVEAESDFAPTIDRLASDANLNSLRVTVTQGGETRGIEKGEAPEDFSGFDKVEVTAKKDLG